MIHEEQLAEHGGRPGIRDENAFESALARPKNLYAYGCNDLYEMAASLAYGLACNHAFIDGNKRTSLVVTETFLAMNGLPLALEGDASRYVVWRALASDYVNTNNLTKIIQGDLHVAIEPLTCVIMQDMKRLDEEIPAFLSNAYADWLETTSIPSL